MKLNTIPPNRFSLHEYYLERHRLSKLTIIDKQSYYLDILDPLRPPIEDDIHNYLIRTSLNYVKPYQPLSDWYQSVVLRTTDRLNPLNKYQSRFLNLVYTTIHRILPSAIEPYYGGDENGFPIIGRCRSSLPLSLLLHNLDWEELKVVLSQLLYILSILHNEIKFTHNRFIAENILMIDNRPVLKGLEWSYLELGLENNQRCSFSGVSYDHTKIKEGYAFLRSNPGNDLYTLLRSIYLIRPYKELEFLNRMVESVEHIEHLTDRSDHRSFSIGLEPRDGGELKPYVHEVMSKLKGGVYNISERTAEQLEKLRFIDDLEKVRIGIYDPSSTSPLIEILRDHYRTPDPSS